MKQYMIGFLMIGIIAGTMLGNTSSSFGAPQTESMCTIGMVKGENGRTCEVPIPDGCTTAMVPGFDQPWADISKGGATTCQFDKQKTDWTTTITGSCGPCRTDNCSAQFSVKFNCSGSNTGGYKPQSRKTH